MEAICIRPASIDDINALLEIEEDCFGVDSFNKRQLAYLISKAKGAFYVAQKGRKIVGCICLLSNKRTQNLRVYSLVVHSSMRGKGVAQLLLEKAFEYFEEEKLHTLSLEVNIYNDAAMSLYKKNGFVISERMPSYYVDGADAYRMKKYKNCFITKRHDDKDSTEKGV